VTLSEQENNRDIIVIGASAGGIADISAILSSLSLDLQASVFIVQHISQEGPGRLVEIFSSSTKIPVKAASDLDSIEKGLVYVAIPDHHLLVYPRHVRVLKGPRENRWRPAIDPLFRSAAIAFGPRVIGIVLGGFLDDGSAGLKAIKRCGGLAIVKAPDGSESSAMPEHAIRAVGADHIVSVHEIGVLISRLVEENVDVKFSPPEDLKKEVHLVSGMTDIINDDVGTPVPLTCPDCGGPLKEIQDSDEMHHYRCIVGHAYSPASLMSEQKLKIEQALWAGIRMMEERVNLFFTSAKREREHGRGRSAELYEEKAREAHNNATLIRDLVFGNKLAID
jgi:two-component system chemotaxis response regulator CheB